jgi:RNA polymerase sigma factor (sigma-70 family)
MTAAGVSNGVDPQFLRQLTGYARQYIRATRPGMRHFCAEDLVSEAVVRRVRLEREGKPVDNEWGWYTTVIRRLFLDAVRAAEVRYAADSACERPFHADADRPLLMRELRAEVARLPRAQQAAVTAMMACQTSQEAAARIGSSPEAVRANLKRAIRTLRDRLNRGDNTEI